MFHAWKEEACNVIWSLCLLEWVDPQVSVDEGERGEMVENFVGNFQ